MELDTPGLELATPGVELDKLGWDGNLLKSTIGTSHNRGGASHTRVDALHLVTTGSDIVIRWLEIVTPGSESTSVTTGSEHNSCQARIGILYHGRSLTPVTPRGEDLVTTGLVPYSSVTLGSGLIQVFTSGVGQVTTGLVLNSSVTPGSELVTPGSELVTPGSELTSVIISGLMLVPLLGLELKLLDNFSCLTYLMRAFISLPQKQQSY